MKTVEPVMDVECTEAITGLINEQDWKFEDARKIAAKIAIIAFELGHAKGEVSGLKIAKKGVK